MDSHSYDPVFSLNLKLQRLNSDFSSSSSASSSASNSPTDTRPSKRHTLGSLGAVGRRASDSVTDRLRRRTPSSSAFDGGNTYTSYMSNMRAPARRPSRPVPLRSQTTGMYSSHVADDARPETTDEDEAFIPMLEPTMEIEVGDDGSIYSRRSRETIRGLEHTDDDDYIRRLSISSIAPSIAASLAAMESTISGTSVSATDQGPWTPV